MKTIISIDGGGVRGLIALQFLKHLEDHLKNENGSNNSIYNTFSFYSKESN